MKGCKNAGTGRAEREGAHQCHRTPCAPSSRTGRCPSAPLLLQHKKSAELHRQLHSNSVLLTSGSVAEAPTAAYARRHWQRSGGSGGGADDAISGTMATNGSQCHHVFDLHPPGDHCSVNGRFGAKDRSAGGVGHFPPISADMDGLGNFARRDAAAIRMDQDLTTSWPPRGLQAPPMSLTQQGCATDRAVCESAGGLSLSFTVTVTGKLAGVIQGWMRIWVNSAVG